MIAAAIVVLVQLTSVRSGRPSPITAGVTTVAAPAQSGVGSVAVGVRGFVQDLASLPQLAADNARLTGENAQLTRENRALREAAASAPEDAAIARLEKDDPADIAADVIGYDPENRSRTVTIDRGFSSGVAVDDGVVSPDGIVGRVIEADPLTSKILLAVDPASQIPAVVQRGRWWGIVSGTETRLRLRFVSQDAKIEAGDLIVTGEGRAFHAGLPIGTIAHVFHPEGALYLTALVDPAVPFGRLHRVLVVPH